MYALLLMLLLILVTNLIKILGAKPWCVCKCKLKAKTVLFVGWLLDVVSCFVFVYVCVFMCVCVCNIGATSSSMGSRIRTHKFHTQTHTHHNTVVSCLSVVEEVRKGLSEKETRCLIITIQPFPPHCVHAAKQQYLWWMYHFLCVCSVLCVTTTHICQKNMLLISELKILCH